MQDYQPQPVNTPQVPISPFDVKSLIGVREKSRPTELTPHLYSVGYDRMGDEGKALIDVKDIRQRDGSECGTAAVMSVIQFYKVGTDDMDELREQLETTEEQGTTPTNIVSYLKSIGLQVEDREGMDLNDLANYWEKGWPVICCIQEYGDLKEESEDPAGVAIEEQLNFENGHWVVVIGGPAQGVLYIQDPAIDNLLEDVGINVKRGRSRIPAIKFLKIWHDEDGNGKKYMRYGIAVGPPSHLNGHGNKSMPTGKPYSHTLASTPRSHGNVFGQGQVTSLKIPMENNISPYNHSEDQPERRVKDLNEPEKEPPSHEFSSTQFNILDQPLLDKLAKIRDRIPDEDLAEDGREEAPHVTVLFGLHTNNPEDVQQVVQNWLQMRGTDPVKARLGAVSLFPANNETAQRGGDYQDVLKVDVESDELHDLNRVLKENLDRTDTYPEYHPHLTLAYLNPGAGWLYVSDDELGDELEFSKLVFSDKNRNEVEIDLTGESDEPGWRCENPPCEWSMLQAGDEDMDMEKYPKPVIHDQEEWERCHPDRYNRSELKALPEEPEQPQPEEPETPPTPASQPDLEPMEVELVEDDEPSTATPVPVEPAPDPYGLTDDEIYALGKWTGAESSNLRQQELSSWRGGYASKLHQDFDSAVRKLPPYQGTIYRGIRVSAQEAARLPYKLGETFILDMTSSASKRKTKAEAEAMRERYDIAKYHEDVGVIFVVAANNGADVSPYQQVGYLKHEDEVLLRKGTFYRVTDVQDHYVRREDEEGQAYGKPRLIYYIALEEIPEQPSKGLKRLGLLQMKELPTCPDGRKMPPNIRSCGGTDGWKGWKSIEPGIGSDFTFYRQAYDRWRVKPDVLGERRLRRAYENGKPADELAIKNDEEFRLTRESGTQERFTNSRSQSSGLPNEGGLLAGQEQEDSSGLPNRTPTGDTCPDGSPINPRTRTCTDKQGYTQGYPGVDEMHIEQDDRMVGGQRRGKDLEEAKPSQPPVQSSPPVETKPTQEPEYVSDPAFQVYLNQAESLLPQPYSFSGSNPQAMAARQALLNYIASLRRSQPEKSLNSPFDENWLKSLFKGVGDLDSPPDPSLPHPIQPHLTKPERRRARRSDNIGNGVAEKKWGEKCPDGSLKPVGSGSCQGRQADSWDGIIDKNNEPGWPDYPDYAPVVGLDIRDPEEREKPLAGHLFPNKKALPEEGAPETPEQKPKEQEVQRTEQKPQRSFTPGVPVIEGGQRLWPESHSGVKPWKEDPLVLNPEGDKFGEDYSPGIELRNREELPLEERELGDIIGFGQTLRHADEDDVEVYDNYRNLKEWMFGAQGSDRKDLQQELDNLRNNYIEMLERKGHKPLADFLKIERRFEQLERRRKAMSGQSLDEDEMISISREEDTLKANHFDLIGDNLKEFYGPWLTINPARNPRELPSLNSYTGQIQELSLLPQDLIAVLTKYGSDSLDMVEGIKLMGSSGHDLSRMFSMLQERSSDWLEHVHNLVLRNVQGSYRDYGQRQSTYSQNLPLLDVSFVQNPGVRNLRTLEISRWAIGADGMEEIANSPYLKDLHRLEIINADARGGARALINSPYLQNTHFVLDNVNITKKEQQMLRHHFGHRKLSFQTSFSRG